MQRGHDPSTTPIHAAKAPRRVVCVIDILRMRRPAVVERLFDVGDDFPNGRSRTLGTPRLAKRRLVRLGGEQHGQSLDPPIGTIVYGHERVIYLGNGEWQPLDETPNP